MARYSRDQRRRSAPSTSPWMTMFYICALVLAPMLFMGMIPSANAQEDAKDTSVTGPGKSMDSLWAPACAESPQITMDRHGKHVSLTFLSHRY